MPASDFAAYVGRLAQEERDVPLSPHPWQLEMALEDAHGDRLIRIPTGLGKTLGVLATWLWHRVERVTKSSHTSGQGRDLASCCVSRNLTGDILLHKSRFIGWSPYVV